MQPISEREIERNRKRKRGRKGGRGKEKKKEVQKEGNFTRYLIDSNFKKMY